VLYVGRPSQRDEKSNDLTDAFEAYSYIVQGFGTANAAGLGWKLLMKLLEAQ